MNNDVDISVLLEEFVEDATGHLQAAEDSLLKLEERIKAGAGEGGLLTALLGSLHTLKGNAGMMGLTSLQQYVHKLETILKKASEDQSLLGPSLFEAFYGAMNILRAGLAHIQEHPTSPYDFSDHIMYLDACVAAGSNQAKDQPKKSEEFGYITQKTTTMKVNFVKLDDLLNLVGELVIHRTALVTLEAKLKAAGIDRSLFADFREVSQLLAKSASDLREGIMKVRMLPIKLVFQKFNRLVRDLSSQHGKDIKLILHGEETEIDKTVIDEIGEPLLHLIRNAVDHGFETPEERKQQGKPARGILRLRACHENSNIVISAEDDGRGIDPQKLRRSAVDKGLISEEEARAMSDQEALQLIFRPGFSTKNQVTETSGRGIGLDVVKKTVVSLNGTIEIDSVIGKGTTFTIRLPLTLAIVSALMVEISGRLFAIPLSGVQESIKVDQSDIHEVEQGEIINLRDKLLPLSRLDKIFHLPPREKREQEYVVIIGAGERRCGIIVDRLRGQQEIVIKPMDDYLGQVAGIAGGTVLGDGTVSLIIDIGSVVSMRG